MQLCPLCGISFILRRKLLRQFRVPAAKGIARLCRLRRFCYRLFIFSLYCYRIRLAVNIASVEFERKRDFFSCVLNFNNGRTVSFYRLLVNSRCYKPCICFWLRCRRDPPADAVPYTSCLSSAPTLPKTFCCPCCLLQSALQENC